MKTFSRRAMFFKLGQSGASEKAEPRDVSLPFSLLHSREESFTPTLNHHFPELQAHASFQSLRQFSVLLQNTSKYHVRAYTLLWTYMDSADPSASGELSSEFIQRHGSIVERNLHIPAGQIRLISPFFNVKPTQTGSRKLFIAPNLLHNEPLQRAIAINVVLDGIVFSNGDFYGPDKLRLSKRYAALRNAERDEAKSVQYHSSLGKSPWDAPSIKALLDSHIEEGRQVHSGFEEAWWQSRRVEAERLRKRLTDKGVAHLQECVDRRLRYKPVSLTKKA